MSFRADGQGRYGHVPPVQYPVSGRPQPTDEMAGLGRRQSFNDGDDAAYHKSPHGRSPSNIAEDELFLTSRPSTNTRPAAVNNVLSGYQHQYQDPTPSTSASAYNPQSFVHQQQPSGSYAQAPPTSLPIRQPSSPHRQHPHRMSFTSPPNSFTPPAYNPAAYVGATSPQRQPTYHGYGGPSAGVYGSPTYTQSPAASYTASFPSQASALAVNTATGLTHSATSPSLTGSFSPNTPSTYDPSQFAADPYHGRSPSGNGAPYGQLSYPPSNFIPTGPNYAANDPDPVYNRDARSGSQSSRFTPSPALPSQGLQRHPTNAPLPRRPSEITAWEASPEDDNGSFDQDRLMQDIEAELGAYAPRDTHAAAPPSNGQYTDPYSNGMGDADDDDPEGTAGVLAMQQAELDDRRFSGTTFSTHEAPSSSNTLPPAPEEQDGDSSDSDLGGMVDLGMLSGGYAGNLAYGTDVGSIPASQSAPRPLPSPGYPAQSFDTYGNTSTYNDAQMDYGDTGGLQTPMAHRLSFDEGDENGSLSEHRIGAESPPKDEYEDLFYHPGLSSRPLPAVPPGPEPPGSDSSSLLSVGTGSQGQLRHNYSNSTGSRYQPQENPENFYAGVHTRYPERSLSASGQSSTPPVFAPARSRTDATEERKKVNRMHQVGAQSVNATLSEYISGGSDDAPVGGFDSITLPNGRKRRFVPSKLSSGDFRRCTEPWALSGIETWIRDMADSEIDLREKTVEEALVQLFTFKVPTMNVADAETLSTHVVTLMLESNLLLPEEEWVKFGTGHISGVLWQMTGLGCYAPKLHEQDSSGRCYSYHCTRTVKKVDLDDLDPEKAKTIDWHVFYGLTKEDLESKPKKEVERQNILHEIVTGEETYIKQLDLFRTLYRDDLRARRPPILKPDRLDKFLSSVFGKLDIVLSINKDNLLAQLKYRQQEQGPWITGFSDIFREWIRKAKADYIEYATGYPRAQYMVRKEAERNMVFKHFLEEKQKHKSMSKQDWTHFLITPLQRLQRYILLLESIDKKTVGDSEERINLQKAIAEIKVVTLECDSKVDETNKRVQMMELDRMLILRPGFHSRLNLDHLGRQLLMEGELTRLGSKGVRWVDVHALLFDHYLIIAKAVSSRDGRDKKYDVSKEPIPMPLLFLESTNDEPIQRQKGIATPLGRSTAAPSASTSQLNKLSATTGGKPGLEHTPTSSSLNSTLSAPVPNESDGKILYPFKVKHLGHEVYVLYASSARDRMDWCNMIMEAKTNHAKALHSQNAEPFRLRVLADAAFHYEMSSAYSKSTVVPVRGTPLDRAICDLESVLGPAQGIAPVCRSHVNCATGFSAFGKSLIAIGTDFGVYISDPANPRGWTRTISAVRVTQIAVLEEFSVCLVISDRALISYPLDVVAPVSDFAPPLNDNPRRAPQRLAKDVTYFATARMKERTLIFYKRKESLHTTFKVLEPIYHKATEKKRFFGGRKSAPGSTESYRDFDEFFFPTECYSLNVFQTYIAVSTSKGVEMLTLDKKQPLSIPDLKAPAIANIAGRVRDQKPLGMFRLNENEFILTYEDCAVYVDKHGDVSRTLIMEYTGKQKKAKGATMYGQYLLLFNDDYVEVRNAENGRLRQIIAGRDVRVIDYGIRGPTGGNAAAWEHLQGHDGHLPNVGDASKGTVKIAMCHPEIAGRQIVLEILLNDGHSES